MENTETPTPRTDAVYNEVHKYEHPTGTYMLVQLCREIERELEETNKRLLKLTAWSDKMKIILGEIDGEKNGDQIDVEIDRLIDERDNAIEQADKLSYAIGKYAGVDVGEHSNRNNPWERALAVVQPTVVEESNKDRCPQCQSADGFWPADYVDNGVGMEKCSPAHCEACGYSEPSSTDIFNSFSPNK